MSNIDWKSEFNSEILRRGLQYYRQGKVDYYDDTDDDCIYAEVEGTYCYEVEIISPGKSGMMMSCTCAHAFKGYNCKHMAAVMCKWEVENKKKTEPGFSLDSDKSPLLKPAGEHIPFFYMRKIVAGFRTKPAIVNEARELIARGDVRLNIFRVIKEERSTEIKACIIGEYRKSGLVRPLEMLFSTDGIISYECGECYKQYHRYYSFRYTNFEPEFCAHILAFVMLADEHTMKYNPGDNTDFYAERFFRSFGREEIFGNSVDEEASGSVVLEPKIVQTDFGLELTFRIGNGGKKFVVKNLTTLNDKIEKREKYELGKDSVIDFATETFDAGSVKLYELIQTEVKRARAVERKMESRRTYYYGGSLEAGKGVPFVGSVVDTVFEMFKGKTIECKFEDSRKTYTLSVCEDAPRVDLKTEAEYDDVMGVKRLTGMRVSGTTPLILDGTGNQYYIDREKFGIIGKDISTIIKPFADAGRFGGCFDFLVGDKRATEFYHNILPKLKESGIFRISEDEKVLSIIKEKAEFTFLLDVENGYITCKAAVNYGDDEFELRPLTSKDYPLPDQRDVGQENPVFELLSEMFDGYSEEISAYASENIEDRHYSFLKNDLPALMTYGEVQSTESFSRVKIRKTPPVKIGVAVESNLLDLTVKSDDMSPEELVALLQSYKKKKKYHKLKSGDFVDLQSNESIAALFEMMDITGVSVKDLTKGKLQIPSYRALYIEKMLEEHDDMVADRDRTYRKLIRDFKTINDADYELPESLAGVLRPYQEQGFKWLKTLETAGFGGILADDMGLGKTLQVIAMMLSSKESADSSVGESGEQKRSCALVVCPASLVFNWTEEIARFAPEMKAVAVAGTKSERREILKSCTDYDFVITSYDLLKRDIDMYEGLSFSHQIIDEAQFIKNTGSQAAKSVKLIKAEHRFALTGTPIENRLSELWSIFDYLMPGFLYGYERFRKDYELPISKNKNEACMQALKNMISPFLLRRKKTDVLKDLPEKLEELYYAKFSNEQQKLYDAQLVRTKGLIQSKDADFDKSKIQILAELTKLRQLCCDPALLLEDYNSGSAKREACLDLISSAIDGGHKILLFSQFTSMFELIEDDLKADGIEYYKLTGSTPKEERIRMVKQFNGDDVPLFLISLKAGGTGLNLTGADVVIHYDPWWNKAAQDQASDRAHRIGQKNTVTVYQLIVKDSIEERIVELQQNKKELSDAILNGETRSIGSMTREELMELLN